MVSNPRSSRRKNTFVLLSALLPNVLSSAIPESPVDVAVIGAGLSGLTAARELLNGGKSVLVLEARDRIGGKVYNKPLKNGGVTEVGAEFVGPTQDKVLKMISDLGLETFKTYNQGKTILWRNGTRVTYQSDPATEGVPPVEAAALVQIRTVQAQLDSWAAELDPNTPWTHPNAAKWDNLTFEQFTDKIATLPDARFALASACKGIFAAEPRELSLLYVIAYIRAAGNETTIGNLGRLTAVEGGGQESRVVGGTGLIPERLAGKVGSDHILLNAAVTKVKQTSERYKIHSRAGTICAKKVVVAMAPPLLQQITFTPELPSDRQALNQQMRMPSIGKAVPIYKTPFWRTEENLNAQVLSDQGSVRVTFDSTPEDSSFGAILGFLLGDEMRALDKLTVEQVQKLVMADYTKYFGASAAQPTELVLQRWDLEEWSRGGPVAITPPGVLSRYGSALRQPSGGIYFAGTETSPYWTGYMDGAIRSGIRVAKEILAQ